MLEVLASVITGCGLVLFALLIMFLGLVNESF